MAAAGDHLDLFRRLDLDGDGKISPAELCACMRAIGRELPAEDAAEWMDSDCNGGIGYEDFAALVAEAEGEEERERSLREAFGVYEMEGTGCITPASLRRVLERLGNHGAVEDCELMIRRFDLDGDGVISFHEFKVMMV